MATAAFFPELKVVTSILRVCYSYLCWQVWLWLEVVSVVLGGLAWNPKSISYTLLTLSQLGVSPFFLWTRTMHGALGLLIFTQQVFWSEVGALVPEIISSYFLMGAACMGQGFIIM